MKNFYLILALGLSVPACDPFTDHEVDIGTNESQDITLTRIFKMRKNFDCDGNLLSEKMVQITRPNALIHIHPSVDTSTLHRSEFSNRSTGESGYASSGITGLYIDMSDSSLAMQVIEGSNTIDYKFYECLKYESNPQTQFKDCVDERLAEEASIVLNVSYEEKTMPGFDSVKPLNCEEEDSLP
jgi:hypothetical protein